MPEKNDEQILKSQYTKISPILPNQFCDPETHNRTEVWAQTKNGVILKHWALVPPYKYNL